MRKALSLALVCLAGACSKSGPGGTGSACVKNADCASSLCLRVGAPFGGETRFACSDQCESGSDCVAGWSCQPVAGLPSNACSCSATGDDVCDGVDNDCDGVVDAPALADLTCPAGNRCAGGTCACSESLCSAITAHACCGDACVDTSTDSKNCGVCAHGCRATEVCTSGSCACEGVLTFCAAANRCLDLRSDSENCGSCGHVCTNGFCVAEGNGLCMTTEPLASHRATPRLPKVSNGRVWWSEENGSIWTLGLSGGEPVHVATLPGVTSLAATTDDAGRWSLFAAAAGSIFITTDSDAGTIEFAKTQDDREAHAIAFDSSNLYWVERADIFGARRGAVIGAPRDGGAAFQIAAVQDAYDLTPSATTICWADRGTKYNYLSSIVCASLDGGARSTIDMGSVRGVATDATNAYWFKADQGLLVGSIMSAPFDGGLRTTLSRGIDLYESLLLDSKTLYWLDRKGAVFKLSRGGGSPVEVFPGPANGIAIDETTLVLTTAGFDGGDGTVLRLSPK